MSVYDLKFHLALALEIAATVALAALGFGVALLLRKERRRG